MMSGAKILRIVSSIGYYWITGFKYKSVLQNVGFYLTAAPDVVVYWRSTPRPALTPSSSII